MLHRLTLPATLTCLALIAACTPQASHSSPIPRYVQGHVQGHVQENALTPHEGLASWYGPGFAGRATANGETFNPSDLTAAHRTLPFDTLVRVTNLNNGRSVVVRINDRGPFVRGRIIDLSRAAAEQIDMIGSGVVLVRLEAAQEAVTTPGYSTAASAGLEAFSVWSKHHLPGELLFLTSARALTPVLVRVVAADPTRGYNTDLLLCQEAYALLGGRVEVIN